MKARDSSRAKDKGVIFVSSSFNVNRQPKLKFKYSYSYARKQSQTGNHKRKDSRREDLTKSFIE